MENLGALFDALDRAGADELQLVPDEPAHVVVGGQRRPLGSSRMTPGLVKAAALEILSAEELASLSERPRTVRFANGDADYLIEVAHTAKGPSLAIRPAPPVLELDLAAGAETSAVTPSRPTSRHGTLASLKAVSIAPAQDRGASSAPITAPNPMVGKTIDPLLRRMVAAQASDLHIRAGAPPALRIDGDIQVLQDRAPLSPADIDTFLRELDACSEAVFAYDVEGLARFRVTVSRDRRGPAIAIRHVAAEIRSLEGLGFPPPCRELHGHASGLVLVAGPLGSGRSTTVAAMVDAIAEERAGHVVVLERPVGILLRSRRSVVTQRDVGKGGFAEALRSVRLEDPDVVVVGEMHDAETVTLATELANAGVLVIGIVDALDTAAALDRLVERFLPDRQLSMRALLRHTVKGVLAQRLCKKSGGGRVVACEMLLEGAVLTTMDESLLSLVEKSVISPREALARAGDAKRFAALLAKADLGAD